MQREATVQTGRAGMNQGSRGLKAKVAQWARGRAGILEMEPPKLADVGGPGTVRDSGPLPAA